jgi:hypothetical protein
VLSDGWQRERWIRRPAQGEVVTGTRIDRFDPELGWVLLENVRGATIGGGTIHSNAAGVRGTREYTKERGGAGGALRVVALGDSFTFGECVSDEETFAARLEQRIAPGEVLNFAVHGYGHDQMLLRLRRDALAYRPDVVLLGFYTPDLERNGLTFRDYAKPYFTLRGGQLELAGPPLPSPDELAARFQLRSANYAEMLWDVAFAARQKRRTRRLSEAILRQMEAEAKRAGARFALVYLPSKNQAKAGEAWPSRVYKHLCQIEGVLCIDPTARIHAFLATQPDAGAHFRCHYSAAVHQQVADAIAEALAGAAR